MVIESDNKIVIQALRGKILVPWQIYNIIEDIRTWQNQDIHLLITHIFRETNMATDWLSKFGHLITASFSSGL